MIQFSPLTFVLHSGGQSLLWRPWTGAYDVADGAEPLVRHIGWSSQPEEEVVAEITMDFGIAPDEVAGVFREFVVPLVAEGFVESLPQSPQNENKTSREDNAGFDDDLRLPFRKIAGLFDPDYGTACVVGNDTGLMHLACALGAPSVTITPHGHHFTWFSYAADERAKHVCLAPACATPMCASECGETAKCAGKIQVEQVLDGIEEVTK